MNREYFLTLRKKKEDRINALLAACDPEGGETRDMSPDEAAEFDRLVQEVEGINGRLAKIEDMEATEEPAPAEEMSEEPEPAPTRGRSPKLRGIAPGSGPAAPAKERRWSLLAALRQSFEAKTQGKRFSGIEAEVHQELLKRRTSGSPPEGILIPLGNEPELRELLYGKQVERRDLTTTTATGAVFTTEQGPFIDLLRKKMVLQELGATFLTGLNGAVAIPRQTGSSTAYWVAEGVAVTASNQTLDQVALTPKTLGAATLISRKLMYQSSIDVDAMVRNDLAKVIALELDRAGINGSGSGAVPTGILQISAIGTASSSLQGGTNGAAITFAKAVAMESLVASANADMGSLKYLTTPGLRGSLKTTVKASGQPVYIFEMDEINGYPCVVSNQVPSTLTKGSASGICHALIFGNWADLLIGQWGGIDTVVNPYTNQLSGSVTISMMLEADVAVRHNESFAIITDALAS